MTEPTGEQIVLRREVDGREITARIAQVGASLRALAVDGADLIATYPDGAPTPGASGITLVPWPNRIRDGRWSQRGKDYQLAISEPAFRNASHGLLRFAEYRIERLSPAEVLLHARVYPQTGYPFLLGTSVAFALAERGIEVTHRVRNLGEVEAPVALGAHPYLAVGDVSADDLTLTVPGATWFPLDERKLPGPAVAVDEQTDLRGGRALAGLDLDRAYGDLARGDDGAVRSVLTAPDGRTVTLWQGEGFDVVQAFRTTIYPGRASAVAIEPMTAPADAFNSGTGLRWLAPDEEWVLRWGVTASW